MCLTLLIDRKWYFRPVASLAVQTAGHCPYLPRVSDCCELEAAPLARNEARGKSQNGRGRTVSSGQISLKADLQSLVKSESKARLPNVRSARSSRKDE